jgi:hypothetical protein
MSKKRNGKPQKAMKNLLAVEKLRKQWPRPKRHDFLETDYVNQDFKHEFAN